MGLISRKPKENKLILSMKKLRTEALLFGTAKRLSMQSDSLMVYRDGVEIRKTNECKYLGVYVNSTLDLYTHFEKSYNKTAERLKPLVRLRKYLDLQSAKEAL